MLIKKIIIKSVVQTINFLNFKPILNQNNMKNFNSFTKKANCFKTFVYEKIKPYICTNIQNWKNKN